MSERYFSKVIVIGKDQSDKTNLVYQLVGKQLPTEARRPNPMDFQSKVFQIPAGGELKMVIWDLSGETRFSAVRMSCYTGTHSIAIVVDANEPEFVQDVCCWMEEISSEIPDTDVVVIVNKKNQSSDQCRDFEAELRDVCLAPVLAIDTTTGEGIEVVENWLLERTIARLIPVI